MLGLAALPDLVLYQRLVLVFELAIAAFLGPDGKPDARQLINDILATIADIVWSIMISPKQDPIGVHVDSRCDIHYSNIKVQPDL